MNEREREIIEVSLDDIIPNRFQPRLSFDEQGLNELAESIRQHGIIQPLVLRKIGDKYEIIAGERRYKASYIAGLTKVPAVIIDLNDNERESIKRYNQGDALFVCGSRRMQINVVVSEDELESFGAGGGL